MKIRGYSLEQTKKVMADVERKAELSRPKRLAIDPRQEHRTVMELRYLGAVFFFLALMFWGGLGSFTVPSIILSVFGVVYWVAAWMHCSFSRQGGKP